MVIFREMIGKDNRGLRMIEGDIMKDINQKIIDAIIEKAEKVCPDSLALIGIYGSVATGDLHKKSDLDLLILIKDDVGWQLGTGFILDDIKVGYDIYCTNWGGLQYDAECHHAQIAKLMDSKIMYIKDQEAYEKLCELRTKAKDFLASEERFQRVNELVNQAKQIYANACLYDDLGRVRMEAYGVLYYLLDAIMLFHGSYYKRGVKRAFEELQQLPIDDVFADNIRKVVLSKEVTEIRELLKTILLYMDSLTKQEKQKEKPNQGLAGTYEEMFSNWRNKVEEASKNKDAFVAYMNMCSFQFMLMNISNEVEIGEYPIMTEYNPDCLEENIGVFDKYLQKYEDVYKQAGIEVKSYSDVDAFVKEYLK